MGVEEDRTLTLLDRPIICGIATGYPLHTQILWEEINKIHPTIQGNAKDADVVFLDIGSGKVNYSLYKKTALFVRYVGECCNYYPSAREFTYGIHLNRNTKSERNVWLPFIITSVRFVNSEAKLYNLTSEQLWFRKPIVWVASSMCGIQAEARKNYVLQLQKKLLEYNIFLECRGALLQNASIAPGGIPNVSETYKDYKFTIAIENNLQDGYITEKIPNALFGNSVPVTVCPPEYSLFPFPDREDWCVRGKNWNDVDSVAARINEVNNDPEAYLAMCHANPLLHLEFYENWKTIREHLRIMAHTIVDEWKRRLGTNQEQ